eukprot:CAMPEP_0114332208 /NCGR_PEP_ID=MMETSP0101-20121206/2927_1 /TAXON_ID=38822 ORGANISM="Pteridomonas danica, Strain PT" /NCGR_SAMPLE_ID=MMETSP0101 /ASSEMBLY_ACC=CAM_ASM_000211 /LENGTH=791 /DNA_ID=CAMNT_0001462801 /DNA_START=303 /DNA_END=2678 /DNA_ORIENTATION=-
MGKSSELSSMQRYMIHWYVPLVEAIQAEQNAISRNEKGTDRALYGPFLAQLGPDKLAILTMNAVMNASVIGGKKGAPFAKTCFSIGEFAEAEVNLSGLRSKYGKGVLGRLSFAKGNATRSINMRARQALENGEWTNDIVAKFGAILIKLFLETAKDFDGTPSFSHRLDFISHKEKIGNIVANENIMEQLSSWEIKNIHPKFLPMLVPPIPWDKHNRGGFLKLHAKFMRTKGSKFQTQVLTRAPLERVFEGLNSLGKLEWKINKPVLEACQEAWRLKLPLGELPPQVDFPLPLPLDKSITRENDSETFYNHFKKVKKVEAKNNDLHSLRCDAQIKLNIADQFKDDSLYFPYNVDFRGRAYPIPPNLNHLGSDMCRGILTFAEKKPLGPNGLYWLKVQLANLCGFDKASFQERSDWTENHMSEVYDSAQNPIHGQQWWTQAENPWQALSVCQELVRIYDTCPTQQDREAFLSSQPIHMDGSCNGLQHYAALGRDGEGGKAVNLIDAEKPGDVYSSVCRIVIARIAELAEKPLEVDATDQERKHHECAKLVHGLIDRKVVKQTVMTSVYGVTFIGARNQIQARLEEKFEAQGVIDPDDIESKAYECANIVARITLEGLEELFTSARGIMGWLGDCARIVAHEGHTMSWITPLGLPVAQPYRRGGIFSVKTIMQTVQVTLNNDDLSVHKTRQRSAFPPNFVHSLDSTHMLLTAIKMQELGLSFTAVHDSYWTHPSDVEVMNEALRRSFVDLYSQPILEDLKETLMIRFPGKEFPEIPERGDLSLEDVMKSTYFFN